MTAQQEEFRQIDKALATYYKRSCKSYTDSNGNGKFLNYITFEQFDDPDLPIENELGTACNPNDCPYIFFDEDFPIPIAIVVTKASKRAYMFYIVQYCWQYGHPPSNEYIRNVLVPKLGGYPHAAAVDNIHEILFVEMYQQVICYMVGFVAGWLFITGSNLNYYISNWHDFDDEYSSDGFGIMELEEGEPMEIQSDWEEDVAM